MLSLQDVLNLSPNATEDELRSKGLLPQPTPPPTPSVIGSQTTPPTDTTAVAKMNPPVYGPPESARGSNDTRGLGAMQHPNAPIVPPVGTPPDVAPMVPPAGADMGIKPMAPPTLNFNERQALPTSSQGVMPGSSGFYENRIERFEDQKANPWGSPENHPGALGKIAHVAAKIGNIAGNIVAPATMANIPGTEANRNEREAADENRLAGAKKEENVEATEKTREQHEADIAKHNANIEDENKRKIDQVDKKITDAETKEFDTNTVNLRKQGLKPNPDNPKGEPVPLKYEDMSELEQAGYDVKQAIADSKNSQAALDKVKADPKSPANQALLAHIQNMAKMAGIAAGKLGIEKNKFMADYFGLDPDGNPLPGVETDEKTGKPVGPKIAAINEKKTEANDKREQFIATVGPSVVQAITTQDNVRRLMKILEPYKTDNTPFSSFLKTIEYKMGKAQTDEIGKELAAINLSSLQQGASVLKGMGGTRSIVALNKALAHTPEPLKDSIMNMYDKMANIDQFTAIFLTEADKYGRKKATAIEPEREKPVNQTEKPPAGVGAGVGAGATPEGKVPVYSPDGQLHYVLKEKKDAMLKDPKYKGWTEKAPETKSGPAKQ
jgi:hypothetical protein